MLIIFAGFAALFSISSYFDLAESIRSFISHYESLQLDEIIFTSFLLFFALFAVLLSRSTKLKREIIKRNIIENELKAALERTEIILESLPVAIYISKARGDYETVYVSYNVERITGHRAEEFTSDSSFWVERIHPDQKEKILSRVAGIFETGHQEREYLWRVADGSYRWFYDYLRLVKSPDGSSDHIIGMWQDVTEYKLIANELATHANKLKESNEQIRSLAEITNVIPWEADTVTRQFTYIGPQAEKVLGHPAGKWYEHNFWAAHIHPDDRDNVVETCLKYACSVDEYEIEYRMISSDGKIVWILDLVSIVAGDGDFKTLKGFMIDISDRKKAEQSLIESENRYRAIVEHTHDLILETDAQAIVLYANPQHREIMGYDPQEMVGISCFQYIHKEDLDAVMTSFQKGLESRESIQVAQYRCKHKNGEWRWLESTGKSFEASSGEVRGVISSRDITDRIEAEQKRKETESRFHALVEYAYDLIVETSADGKFLFANQNHKSQLGYDPGDLVGKNVFDFIHPDDISYVISRFMEAAKNFTSTEDVIFRYRHKDGSWRWLESIGKPFKTADGELRGVITSRDITERKQTEDEIIESKERYRTLVEYSHDLIIEIDIEGKFLFANQNHKNQLGYDPEELIGTSIFDNIHPEDKNAALNRLLTGLSNLSNADTLIHRYKHKNGQWRWLESIGTPFKTSSGETRAVIYSKDITEHKMEEEIRREIEERYRTLVENSYDMIAEASPDSRFLYINPKFRELLGYEPEDIINTNIFGYVHQDDKPLVLAEFSRALVNNSPGHAVYRYRHKNGNWRWIESAGKTYKTSAGELRAVIASRDVTEQKKMDEEILKSQKLESLGVLAGGIAHDFNNMLTIILGNIGLARINLDPDDKISNRLEEAERAIKRATGLTQQLLTFSKGGTPNKKSMSIKELLKESALFALRGSNILPQFFINDDLEKVDIDEGQIDQVINNLVINSKQAMPEGGVIDVGAENKILKEGNAFNLPEGKYVKMYIKDHGAGIEKKYLQKIFDPFFTTKAKGSGLGLATSYSIIKKHNGYIVADSIPGACTTVTVYLPVSGEAAPTVAEKESKPINGEGNILIMEDDGVIAGLLGDIVRQLGYSPSIVTSSSMAVKTYSDSIESGNKFDAVILDLTIPGDVGGKETLKRLEAIDPDIKAIITSGYFGDQPMSEYIDYGFKAYITKPYNIVDIGESLNNVTNRTIR